jgi:hypothetical protein
MVSGLFAVDKTVTLEGTLVCAKCYLTDNSLTHNYHFPGKKCGTMCLNKCTPAGLLTQDKEFYAIIAPSSSLADHVGRMVRITGAVHGGSILAAYAEAKEGGEWKKVKLENMM